MSLEDLYKQVLLDHYRSPRNKGELPTPPAVKAEGYNPLCGDEVSVYLMVDDGRLRDIKISGRGCSISQAAASMMGEAVAGKDMGEARKIIQRFRDMMQSHEGDLGEGVAIDESAVGSEMGDLEALKGVVKFPVRIKCATLPWATLEQGLDEAESGAPPVPASTEEPAH